MASYSVRAETITRPAQAEFAHKKIFHNGSAEFAVVELLLEPLSPENGVEYIGRSGTEFLPAECAEGVEEGVFEATRAEILNGGLVVGVKVTILDCKYHEVDSNRRTFRLAAQGAFWNAMREAEPALL